MEGPEGNMQGQSLPDLSEVHTPQLPPQQSGHFISTPIVSHTHFDQGTSHEARMVVKPEKYDGKGDWAEYISHFNDFAELGGWDNRAKCLVLPANLRGAA